MRAPEHNVERVMTSAADQEGYWKSPAVWLALLAAAAICVLGIRAFLDPVAASAGFGLPMTSPAETSFVQVYGARNAVLGAFALILILARMIVPLAILFAAAMALPLLDAWVIASRNGLSGELLRHALILMVLAVIAALLWRRVCAVARS